MLHHQMCLTRKCLNNRSRVTLWYIFGQISFIYCCLNKVIVSIFMTHFQMLSIKLGMCRTCLIHYTHGTLNKVFVWISVKRTFSAKLPILMPSLSEFYYLSSAFQVQVIKLLSYQSLVKKSLGTMDRFYRHAVSETLVISTKERPFCLQGHSLFLGFCIKCRTHQSQLSQGKPKSKTTVKIKGFKSP